SAEMSAPRRRPDPAPRPGIRNICCKAMSLVARRRPAIEVPVRGRPGDRLVIIAAGASVLVEAGLLAGRGGRFSALLSDVALPVAALLATAACLASARARAGRQRLGW